MTLDLYLAFVAATSLLILTPGPMVALIVGNALRYGPKYSFVTVACSVLAMSVQLTLVSAGLAAILAEAGAAFFWIKWAGVLYLIILGLRTLNAPDENLSVDAPARKPLSAIFWEAVFVAGTNPKTLLFYGAFFPLFISAQAPAAPQLATLSLTFMAIAATLDCCWVVFASKARPFVIRAGRWRHRITGGVYLTAAAGLAAIRK